MGRKKIDAPETAALLRRAPITADRRLRELATANREYQTAARQVIRHRKALRAAQERFKAAKRTMRHLLTDAALPIDG